MKGTNIENKEDRFERKFSIIDIDILSLENKLYRSPLFFKTQYANRFVNSIYFDDIKYQSWMDNIDGMSVREKLSYRWYGDDFNITKKSFFEIKSKKNQIGTKFRIPVEKKINLNLITKYEFLDNFMVDKDTIGE